MLKTITKPSSIKTFLLLILISVTSQQAWTKPKTEEEKYLSQVQQSVESGAFFEKDSFESHIEHLDDDTRRKVLKVVTEGIKNSKDQIASKQMNSPRGYYELTYYFDAKNASKFNMKNMYSLLKIIMSWSAFYQSQNKMDTEFIELVKEAMYSFSVFSKNNGTSLIVKKPIALKQDEHSVQTTVFDLETLGRIFSGPLGNSFWQNEDAANSRAVLHALTSLLSKHAEVRASIESSPSSILPDVKMISLTENNISSNSIMQHEQKLILKRLAEERLKLWAATTRNSMESISTQELDNYTSAWVQAAEGESEIEKFFERIFYIKRNDQIALNKITFAIEKSILKLESELGLNSTEVTVHQSSPSLDANRAFEQSIDQPLILRLAKLESINWQTPIAMFEQTNGVNDLESIRFMTDELTRRQINVIFKVIKMKESGPLYFYTKALKLRVIKVIENIQTQRLARGESLDLAKQVTELFKSLKDARHEISFAVMNELIKVLIQTGQRSESIQLLSKVLVNTSDSALQTANALARSIDFPAHRSELIELLKIGEFQEQPKNFLKFLEPLKALATSSEGSSDLVTMLAQQALSENLLSGSPDEFVIIVKLLIQEFKNNSQVIDSSATRLAAEAVLKHAINVFSSVALSSSSSAAKQKSYTALVWAVAFYEELFQRNSSAIDFSPVLKALDVLATRISGPQATDAQARIHSLRKSIELQKERVAFKDKIALEGKKCSEIFN